MSQAGKPIYSRVIWDWNGTLYDDLDWCMDALNTMLAARGLPQVDGVEGYRRVFGFPIRDYYMRAGFDFATEPFEVLAEEFMRRYHEGDEAHNELHTGARHVLQTLQAAGVCQVILSASRHDHLRRQLQRCGVADYFDQILGITDIYAKSKVELGLAYIKQNPGGKTVLVGDTEHDFEVAQALGADCLLVAAGHQGRETLARCGVPVLETVAQVPEHVLGTEP